MPRLVHCERANASAVAGASPRVAVIGGGVIGLTTALRVHERFPAAQVTIIAEKLATETTSEGAAGLWKPYAITGTPSEKINRWGKDTFDHYLSLYMSAEAPATGIFMCPAYELYKAPVPSPDWAKIVPSFRQISPEELRVYDPTSEYTYGIAYDTIISEGRVYMHWLLDRLAERGVTIQRSRLESFHDLSADYDAIVNCSGLGSRTLAKDASMQPIRGHVIRVKAPWVRYHIEAHGGDDTPPCYIIPNADTVVLGGTKQFGDEDVRPRQEERDAILARCRTVMPALESAEVVCEWVGLRPGRPSIRLELEWMNLLSEGKKLPVVHNYGHGGSGLTLAWGCAGDAVGLIHKSLTSKLNATMAARL